jgi:hypothetical protein
MRTFAAVWSLRRGVLETPEVLDKSGQLLANMRADADVESDRIMEVLRDRATSSYRYERDPVMTEDHLKRELALHGNSREARMMYLAGRIARGA